MTRFRVTIFHDACTTHDVDADDEEGAISTAFSDVSVSLCHQCSNEIELGDPIRAACVENLDTGETNMDPDPDPEVSQLRERVAELEAQVAVLRAPLTDAQIFDACQTVFLSDHSSCGGKTYDLAIARAIEAVHGIGVEK